MKNLSLVRDRRREDTRRRLMDAAIEVFSRLGYERATVDLVAQGAGFSKGAFYVHFDSKEEMFRAVLNEATDWPGSHTENLDGLIDSLAELVGGRPYWAALATEFTAHAWRNDRIGEAMTQLWSRCLESLEVAISAEGADQSTASHQAALMLYVFRGSVLDPGVTDIGVKAALHAVASSLGLSRSTTRDSGRAA